MASDQRSPEAAGGPTPMKLGMASLARSVGRGAIQRGGLGAPIRRAGDLATSISSFGRNLGGSLRSRPVRASFAPSVPEVRFPAGVWSMPAAEAPLPSNIDPAMAALQARLKQNKAPKTPTAVTRRGLPSTLRRHGMSHSGAGTGPSGVVRRLAPADTFVPRNDGHFSTAPARPRPISPAAAAGAGASGSAATRAGAQGPSAGWTSKPAPRPRSNERSSSSSARASRTQGATPTRSTSGASARAADAPEGERKLRRSHLSRSTRSTAASSGTSKAAEGRAASIENTSEATRRDVASAASGASPVVGKLTESSRRSAQRSAARAPGTVRGPRRGTSDRAFASRSASASPMSSGSTATGSRSVTSEGSGVIRAARVVRFRQSADLRRPTMVSPTELSPLAASPRDGSASRVSTGLTAVGSGRPSRAMAFARSVSVGNPAMSSTSRAGSPNNASAFRRAQVTAVSSSSVEPAGESPSSSTRAQAQPLAIGARSIGSSAFSPAKQRIIRSMGRAGAMLSPRRLPTAPHEHATELAAGANSGWAARLQAAWAGPGQATAGPMQSVRYPALVGPNITAAPSAESASVFRSPDRSWRAAEQQRRVASQHPFAPAALVVPDRANRANHVIGNDASPVGEASSLVRRSTDQQQRKSSQVTSARPASAAGTASRFAAGRTPATASAGMPVVPFTASGMQTTASGRRGGSLRLDRIHRHAQPLAGARGLASLDRALPVGTIGARPASAKTPTKALSGPAPTGDGAAAAGVWASRLQAAFGGNADQATSPLADATTAAPSARPNASASSGTSAVAPIARPSASTSSASASTAVSAGGAASARSARTARPFGQRWTASRSARRSVATNSATSTPAGYATNDTDLDALRPVGSDWIGSPQVAAAATSPTMNWSRFADRDSAGTLPGLASLVTSGPDRPLANTAGIARNLAGSDTALPTFASSTSTDVANKGIGKAISPSGPTVPSKTTNAVVRRTDGGMKFAPTKRAATANAVASGGYGVAATSTNGSDHVARRRPVRERRTAALDVLRRSPAIRARALPSSYRALAAHVTDTPIRIAHDATARAALSAAGATAATVGRTILMERAPTMAPRDRELVAHEMVHAAANTKIPRFFDDPHHDHEERTAVSVGRLARSLSAESIRTVPVPPIMGGPTGNGMGTSMVAPPPFGAHTAVGPPTGSTGMGAAASEGAAASAGPRPQIRRSAGGRSTTTLRRSGAAGGSGSGSRTQRSATGTSLQRQSADGGATPAVNVSNGGGQQSSSSKQSAAGSYSQAKDRAPSTTERLDQIEELAALIEARVLAELERRGGQHRGWI
jgi:hypothetical protein